MLNDTAEVFTVLTATLERKILDSEFIHTWQLALKLGSEVAGFFFFLEKYKQYLLGGI